MVMLPPGERTGLVAAPPSKSDAHRKLLLAALAGRGTWVRIGEICDDVRATIDCLRALGVSAVEATDGVRLAPGNAREEDPSRVIPTLDARESGTTLRFLLPAAMVLRKSARFVGCGRLPERPVTHLMRAMADNGVRFSREKLPFTAEGRLRSGVYRLPGDVSSQYVSALLMALPFLPGNSELVLTTPLESREYVSMTQSVMRLFGLRSQATPDGYFVPGGQTGNPPDAVSAEGDWSNAAFFLAAGALGKRGVTVSGLSEDSAQGDRQILAFLMKMGARVERTPRGICVRGGDLRGIRADIRDCPDLAAPLAVIAACAEGESVFTGAKRLRLKETDRLETVCALINDLGGHAEAAEDALIVHGGGLIGGQTDARGDHRLAMAAAVAATGCRERVQIWGAEAVSKSFPSFFQSFSALSLAEKGRDSVAD